MLGKVQTRRRQGGARRPNKQASTAAATPTSPQQATQAREPVSIRILTYPTGRRGAVLAIGDELPCPWVTVHLLDLTLKPLKIRTIRNRALAVARFLLFCRQRGIDYVERCRGAILAEPELIDLALHMRGNASSPRTTARSDFAAAIAFLCSTTTRLRAPDDPSTPLLMGEFRSAADRHGPRGAVRPVSPRLGLTEDQRDAFLSAILPSSANRGSMAFRNYVIMFTAYSLGLRTGELLGLKVCDIDLCVWPAKLTVVERVADPEDPRSLPAAAKTLGRGLPLSPQLSLAFQQLIDDRGNLPHPYVFVNCFGAPLGERGLRAVYHELGSKNPILKSLCNHMLRHDWNDRWNRMTAAHGWDEAESVRHQRHAMGWSADSDMTTRYGRRSLEESASARHLRLQEEDFRRSGTAPQ